MAQGPRITHIASRPDDLQQHIITLASGLAERRVDVYVVGPLERPFRQQLGHLGVRWVNLPLPGTLDRRLQKQGADDLSRFLAGNQPRLVHAHGIEAAQTAALALRKLSPRPPLVCSPHGIPAVTRDGKMARMLERRAQRRALAACDVLIAPSEAERTGLTEFHAGGGRRSHGEIAIVPPGVIRRRQSPLFDVGEKRYGVGLHRDATIVAVTVNMDRPSPLAEFLQSAALVSNEIPSVEFAILGDGSALETVKSMAHSLGLSGSTVFLGRRPDALDVISSCNVFVALRDDATGVLDALEALARNLRVVGADAPGLREVFAGVKSVPLVPLSDAQAVADAICGQLEGMSAEEDQLDTPDGMAWGVSEVLAAQEEYDLDRPGLEPVPQDEDTDVEVARLLDRYSAPRMISGLIEVYNRLIEGTP